MPSFRRRYTVAGLTLASDLGIGFRTVDGTTEAGMIETDKLIASFETPDYSYSWAALLFLSQVLLDTNCETPEYIALRDAVALEVDGNTARCMYNDVPVLLAYLVGYGWDFTMKKYWKGEELD